MSRWSVNTHTFSKVSGSIVMNSLLLDDYLISGSLTKNLNDTSKVKFSVPNEQGKDLVPGATLVDVKYGNDRKFFGTVSKKTLNNLTGIYDFEAVGVLGSYQFMPNYEDYGVDTIESYIATEMSRFKGTASSPYDCDNPWTLVYTGHNEIPSTYGDIETENLGLIPSFNLNLQKTSANAYEFLRLITRDKNYLLPSSVTSNKTSLFWYEEGEKAYFKRISGVNEQTVDYDDNLISYTYENTPQVTKYYAKNTVEGAYPSYGQTTYSQYPATFNFKVLKLPQKNDKTAYSFDELYQAMDRAVPSWGAFEAYAFDKHILDESVPWFDMSKKVRMNMYMNGMEVNTNVNIVQIVYDFCDSSKDRVKLGRVSNSITVSSEQESRDFQAALKDRLETSGGQMSGAITYDGGTSFDGDELKIRDRYALTCNLLDSALIERGALDGSTGAEVDWTARIRSEFTQIKPNTTYTVSWAGNAIPCMFYYSSTSAYVTCELTSNEVTSYTFTTPSGVGFVKFTWGKSGNAYITPSDISNVQLEKGSQASSFVPYTMDGVEVAEKLRICEPLVAYGTEIPSNENLNTPTYVNVGLYYRTDNATVTTFSNCPTTVGFSMLVRNVNKTDVNSSAKTWQYLTREITDINGNQFIQTAFCGSTVGTWVFGEWKQKTTLNASATVTTKYFTVPTANVWQQIHSTSVSAGLFYVRARASFSYARPLAIALIGYDGNGKQYSRNDNVSKDYGGILIDGNSMSWLETSAIIKTSGATTIYVYVAYASATNDDSTLEFELQKLA